MNELNLWPPQRGWIARYHPNNTIYEFTGDQNTGGGYNVNEIITKRPSGGLSNHILDSDEWTLYVPIKVNK